MGVRGGLGLGVGEERIIVGDTVVWTGAEVGHHHEPPHARSCGGVDYPDRRVAIDGVGARRVATARAGGEDHRIVPAQQFGQRGDVKLLNIGDDGRGAGLCNLV